MGRTAYLFSELLRRYLFFSLFLFITSTSDSCSEEKLEAERLICTGAVSAMPSLTCSVVHAVTDWPDFEHPYPGNIHIADSAVCVCRGIFPKSIVRSLTQHAMAGLVAAGGEGLPACLVLIYGIPGSGKSLLTRHLLASSRSSASGDGFPWSFIPVHFDNLYPADLRLQTKQEVILP